MRTHAKDARGGPATPVDEELLLAQFEAAGHRPDTSLRGVIDHLYLFPTEKAAHLTHRLYTRFDWEARMRGTLPNPFMPSPEPEALAAGTIPIGTLLHYPNEVVPIPLTGHIYEAGGIQLGKTTLATHILLAAYEAGHRCIALDPLGRFPEIAGSIPPGERYVVRAPQFLVNPFDPPAGLDIREWLGPLANIEREVSYYRKNTENTWMDTALSVLDAGAQLNLHTFRAALDRRRPRRYGPELDSWERVKNTVDSALHVMPFLGVVSSRGLAEILSRRVVIFDWSTLRNNLHKKYLTLLALAWLLASRPLGSPWNMLVVCDEVHELTSTELARTIDTGEPFFNVAIRTAGNKGVSFLTIDQNPAFTHPVVRSNASVKILFRLDGGEDKRTMAQDLSLNPEQAAYLSMLQPREAVVKLPGLTPFVVHVPEVEHVHREADDRIA